MLLQLDPPLPVITPKGSGIAHILIDYGAEYNLMWTVFIDATGECWTFDNKHIRACKNFTLGRGAPEQPRDHTFAEPEIRPSKPRIV